MRLIREEAGVRTPSRADLPLLVKRWGLFEETKAPRGVKLPPTHRDVRGISSWDFCWPSHRKEAVGADTPCSGYSLLGVVSDQHRFNRRMQELYFETTFFFLLNLNNVNAKVSNGEMVLLFWQSSLEAFRMRAWVWHLVLQMFDSWLAQ